MKISKDFKAPISAITYYDEYDDTKHNNIIEDINDERCDTIKRGIGKEGI